MNRRTFTVQGTFAMAVLAGSRVLGQTAALPASPAQTSNPPRPPALPTDMVKEFVVAAHSNLEKTRTMLAAEPGLVNATWDWGGGDFEQAIGGAGHMGRKDIADFLISQGARMDIFVAAMLGNLDLVQAYLKAQPAQVRARGPHGIPLLAHAKMGAKNGVAGADAVAQYLESLTGEPPK